MEHGYPFLRAAMCTLMRDISTNVAILDIIRGAPSIYMLYLGYDEVAHHSGPWTSDAYGDLKRLDKTLARLRRVLKDKATRAYDFIILSDHGQSFGPTFLQRYGLSIKEFIEQQLPKEVTVAQAIGGDTGASGLQGVAGELANMQGTGAGSNTMSRAVAKQGQKLAEQGMKAGDNLTEMKPASVTAYGSGNAAQVYFDLYPRKIKLSELEAAYPNMIDALVQHEGIGMVIGYDDNMMAVALGKGGQRNLCTGEVIGVDPVAPYANAEGHGAGTLETRTWQLNRVMEFPNAGDLWLISTVYPDGTVAALEELIGNHGGLGGEQTDAFIFHPADMEVMETRNSTDVFHILNNHRGKPVAEKPPVAKAEKVADWAPHNLVAGIKQWSMWIGLALRCMTLNREAYQQVVDNPYMTGPAVLIGVVVHLDRRACPWKRIQPRMDCEFICLLDTGRGAGVCGRLAADQAGNVHQDAARARFRPHRLRAFVPYIGPGVWPGDERGDPGVGFPVRLDGCGDRAPDTRVAHRGTAAGGPARLRHRHRHRGYTTSRRKVYSGRLDGKSRHTGQVTGKVSRGCSAIPYFTDISAPHRLLQQCTRQVYC